MRSQGPAPVLLFPDAGATMPYPLYFMWNEVGGAVAYQLQIDNDADFSSPEYVLEKKFRRDGRLAPKYGF